MHQGFEKGYSYLLSKLIPRQFLSAERIEGMERALTGGNRLDLIGEAYRAMEELAAKGIFLEKDTVRRGNEISLTYKRSGCASSITPACRDHDQLPGNGGSPRREARHVSGYGRARPFRDIVKGPF